MQPPKQNRFLIWSLVIVALFLFLLAISPDARQGFMEGLKPMIDAQNNEIQSETSTVSAATASALAVPAPQWTITHTFAGTGTSQTATFAVNGEWQLNWNCNPTSVYSVTIDVDRPGQQSPIFPAIVSEVCTTSVYSGTIGEHNGGTFYLAVTSQGPWTAQIEQLV